MNHPASQTHDAAEISLPQHPSTRPINLQPACQHLRHKMMYVDPRQATPGYVDDGSDTRVFLCARTQEVLGPDDGPVGPEVCGTGRGCTSIGHDENVTSTVLPAAAKASPTV